MTCAAIGVRRDLGASCCWPIVGPTATKARAPRGLFIAANGLVISSGTREVYGSGFRTHNAPEPQMRDRGVNGLRHACGGAVAAAVVGGAEVRAALGHLARDPDVGRALIA